MSVSRFNVSAAEIGFVFQSFNVLDKLQYDGATLITVTHNPNQAGVASSSMTP